MRKIYLYLLFAVTLLYRPAAAHAQITTLDQNFDVVCVLDSDFPSGWQWYNPLSATVTKGRWNCTAEYGRPQSSGSATPGLRCSGYYDASYHVDTSYLILPLMNLSSYLGKKIYLQFDAKTSVVAPRSDLSVFVSYDDIFNSSDTSLADSDFIAPRLIDVNDTMWATHEIDLSGFETTGNFFVGFRYVSVLGQGSIWSLDNMRMTPYKTGVANIEQDDLPLTLTGIATREQLTIACDIRTAGSYDLTLYDMVGRQVHKEVVSARTGHNEFALAGLGLHSGMYCIRLGNGQSYGITKAIVN